MPRVGEFLRRHFMSAVNALLQLASLNPVRAEVVKLRFFAGLTMPEVAQTLGISLPTAERYWTFARTWLYADLKGDEPSSDA